MLTLNWPNGFPRASRVCPHSNRLAPRSPLCVPLRIPRLLLRTFLNPMTLLVTDLARVVLRPAEPTQEPFRQLPAPSRNCRHRHHPANRAQVGETYGGPPPGPRFLLPP